MGRMVTLKNGETKPIIDFDDIVVIVRDTLGDEVAECINTEINEWCDELNYVRDELEYSDKERQRYCDAIFNAQVKLDALLKIINVEKYDSEKTLEKCAKDIAEIVETFEET